MTISPPKFHLGDKVAYAFSPSIHLGKVTKCSFVAESDGEERNKWVYTIYRIYKNKAGVVVDHLNISAMEKRLVIFVDKLISEDYIPISDNENY